MRRRSVVVIALALGLLAACSASATGAPSSAPRRSTRPATTPARQSPSTKATSPGRAGSYRFRFTHVVVVVEENHAFNEIIGSSSAPYLNTLARHGLLFTRSHGVTHPSQPNYLALFSGSTQGISDDSCPHTFRRNNLGAQLRVHRLSFAGYSQSLPSIGDGVCIAGPYARRHVPWTDFANLPGSVNKPFSAFPKVYTEVPRLAFVIPDVDHDMHDGTIGQADTWLRRNLGGYATWARTHRSLLLVTWDEDDGSQANRIATIAYGAGVRPGRYIQHVDHYRVLRTLEAIYHLPALGVAAHRRPIAPLVGG